MTKRWKLKTTSSNILLVLITLILVKAEWIKGENKNSREVTKSIDSINDNNLEGETHIYVGNDNIADYFFHSSTENSSLILEGINKCLDNFQLITCVKMLLLNRINDAMSLMEEPDVVERDVQLLNGLLIFKIKNETISSGSGDENRELSLDEEIAFKVKRIFHKRSLLVNLLPKLKIEIEPTSGKHSDDFICFSYRIREELDTNDQVNEGRKKKGGGMSMMMMVPQLIMMGLMPFTLASLKAMVMNAVMINMMALNGAIFMTIRNLVFGPRQGDNVKYVNYGYSKDRQTQSKRPVLIIHSPAAFVKQPPVHKKRVQPSHYHATQSYFPQNHHLNSGSSNYHYQTAGDNADYEDTYYVVQQDENTYHGQGQEIQKRNELGSLKGHYNFNATRQVANNLKNSNQRIYRKDEKSQKPKYNNAQSAPSFVETNIGNNKAKSKYNYSDIVKGNVQGEKSYSTLPNYRLQSEAEKRKNEFKASPQWHSVNF